MVGWISSSYGLNSGVVASYSFSWKIWTPWRISWWKMKLMKLRLDWEGKPTKIMHLCSVVFLAWTYYRGLKFVPLGFKRLLILQSVNKVKLNLSSCSFIANLTIVKHVVKFNFTLLTDCIIINLLNPGGTNFSPP